MDNFFKGVILIILGICIGLLTLLVPEAIGIFIPLGTLLVVLGILKLFND